MNHNVPTYSVFCRIQSSARIDFRFSFARQSVTRPIVARTRCILKTLFPSRADNANNVYCRGWLSTVQSNSLFLSIRKGAGGNRLSFFQIKSLTCLLTLLATPLPPLPTFTCRLFLSQGKYMSCEKADTAAVSGVRKINAPSILLPTHGRIPSPC